MARVPILPATDEGWPYPDGLREPIADDDLDLDVLEIRVDRHLYDALSDEERSVLLRRFGLVDGRARSMKELAAEDGATHGHVRTVLESALDKVRAKLASLDEG